MGTFCSTIMEILLVSSWQSITPCRRLWEVALGKYDNWCLFIVIEICSTAQRNSTPQRLWLAAPGSKTSKIIHISTASSVIQPSSDALHKNSCQLPQHFAHFPLCVLRRHAVPGEIARHEAFGKRYWLYQSIRWNAAWQSGLLTGRTVEITVHTSTCCTWTFQNMLLL